LKRKEALQHVASEHPGTQHPGTSAPLAPYMAWAKTRPSPRFDLAGSNVLTCSIADLPGASGALALSGSNDNGYAPLMAAIAARYGVRPSQVTTAQGTSGANFLVCAAMLERGDDVLVETPGYDPLLAAPRLLGGNIRRFQRTFENGWALDPSRVAAAMTAQTRLVIITSPHNPTGTLADVEALRAVGRIAEEAGAHVLVDEVYLDASGSDASVAASLGDAFITTGSLTKSYGLSGLRSGWVLSSEAIAARLRRARDVIDGTGPIVTERLSVLAFEQLDRLIARTRALLDVNTALVRDFLHSRPELEFVYPAGGTVVFPRLRGVESTDRFADRLMTERETAVVPGRFFDAPAHFRIGFGGDTEPLRGGLAAIAAAIARAEWS
jgi:aspartate/methionine/tyrosine aminotransferase